MGKIYKKLYYYFGKRKHYLLLVLCCITLFPAYGQEQPSYARKENNIWLQGASLSDCVFMLSPVPGLPGWGIDFNTGSPEPTWCRGNRLWHSFQTASDVNGNLLFYTDGVNVYNRNHQFMPHGWDILDTGNLPSGYSYLTPTAFAPAGSGASQCNDYDGTVIIPMPGNSHKYYIFKMPNITIEYGIAYGETPSYQLYATVVDMELDNGLGDVDTNFHGVLIDDGAVEPCMEGIVGDNCDYWLLAYGAETVGGSGEYKAFHITAEGGIDPNPVVSILPLPLSYYFDFQHELLVSPDRHKIAMSVMHSDIQVADFDPATGQLSNSFLIATYGTYDLAFSPNSQLLYLSNDYGVGFRQYNLANLSGPFYQNSFNDYAAFERDVPLKLGPDGKIYGSCYDTDPYFNDTLFDNLDACDYNALYHPFHVQNPDIYGPGCNADTMTGSPLNSLRDNMSFGGIFPNEVPILVYDTASEVKEVPLCFHQPTVVVTPGVNGTDYHWKVNTAGTTFPRVGDDNTDTLIATEPGTYAVTYFTTNPCTFHIDTFIVKDVNYSLYLGPDQVSCNGEAVRLQATELPGAAYQWSDGSQGSTLDVNVTDTYWVAMSYEGCTARDSVLVDMLNVDPELGDDTVVCAEDPFSILLKAQAPVGADIQWNTGATDANLEVHTPGLYEVEVNYKGCYGSDSILISEQYCDCPLLIPTAFTPNGDGRNDRYAPAMPDNCPVQSYSLEIYNRWGQRVFVSFKPEEQWDGTLNGKAADVGVYMYRLRMTVGLRKKEIVKNGDFTLFR